MARLGGTVGIGPSRDRGKIVSGCVSEQILEIVLGGGLDEIRCDVGDSLVAHGTPGQGGRESRAGQEGCGEHARGHDVLVGWNLGPGDVFYVTGGGRPDRADEGEELSMPIHKREDVKSKAVQCTYCIYTGFSD